MPATIQQRSSWKVRRKQEGNRANHGMGTAVYGKVYYLKQEVAATLKNNIIIGKNSPLRKNGPKCISALIGLLSICSFDAVELVNRLICA
jgi:hypothetical protein